MASTQPKFTSEDVARLAKLARLELTQEEMERMSGELAGILQYVSKLQELKPEAAPAQGEAAALRADAVVEWPEAQGLVQMAPDHTDKAVRVPPVFNDRA